MKIGIFGAGYVGLCTAAMSAEYGHDVVCCDVDKQKINILEEHGILPIYEPGLDEIINWKQAEGKITFTSDPQKTVTESEIIFLCVGTPPLPDGNVDMQYVDSCVETILAHANSDKIIVNKSTVPVGTARRMCQIIDKNKSKFTITIISNPEFLKEGSAVEDTLHPDRIVIGYDDDKSLNKMLEFYITAECPKLCVKRPTAELIKYASNSFLATKISFINMMSQLCDKTGADVKEVARGMGLDKRIGAEFLKAGIGYGGSCFGKDVSALIKICENHNVDSTIVHGAQKMNYEQLYFVLSRILCEIGELVNKNILVLGLSFKPNTDDLRDAPSIRLVKAFINNGANVYVHDPVCVDAFAEIFPEVKTELPESIDAVVLVTEWEEYLKVNSEAWAVLIEKMKTPIVFDCRNVLDAKQLERLGCKYKGVGI